MGFYRCMPDGSVSPTFDKQGFYRCYPAVSGGGEEVWLMYFDPSYLGVSHSRYERILFSYDSSNLTGYRIDYKGKTTYMNTYDGSLRFNTAAKNGSNIYFNTDCSNTFNGMNNISSSDWNDLVNFFNFSLIEIGSYMFCNCGNFNQSVNLPNIVNGSNMFNYCEKLNHPFNLPNLIDGSHMFYHCNILNKPVTMPNLTNGAYMFYGCNRFNQSVDLSNLTYGLSMFSSCANFNQPVNLPKLTIGGFMFYGCANLNQPVNFPNLTNGSNMFYYCTRFNRPVTIPNTVKNFENMFGRCTNMSSNIYINYNASFTRENFRNMLYSKNNSKRINIFCNNLFVLNGSTASVSLVGYTITWTATTNGWYNARFNIYLYNNYSG